MRIQVEHSLAIIIDIQERLFPHMHERSVLEQNAGKAIEGLEVLSVPLWLTQQYTRGLGPTRTTTYESLLFKLCRQAGSETFKRISGIVK